MSTKQEMIKEMDELQQKFIAFEHKDGLDPFDYYTPRPGHPLEGYREKYAELSKKVLEMAHAEVGSEA